MPFQYTLTGIGNALVDLLYEIDDSFLQTHNLVKGQMKLVDAEEHSIFIGALERREFLAGGSCANSLTSFGNLGGKGAFIGKISRDKEGEMFHQGLKNSDIHFAASYDETGATGRCAVLISDDAARTMVTSLGVAGTLNADDVDTALIENSNILYLEGYLYDQACAKQAFDKAAQIMKKTGGIIALTVSDLFCVERHREDFFNFAKHHCDILFANESEMLALFEAQNIDDILLEINSLAPIVCVTKGEKGALVISGEEYFDIAPQAPEGVIDTNGAGDGWAAGFLYGYSHNLEIAACGMLGSVTAGEIIGHFGAQAQSSLKERSRFIFSH